MASATRRSRNRKTPTQARAARRARRQKRRRILRWGGGTIVGALAVAFIASLFLPSMHLSGAGGRGGLFRGAPDGPGERIASDGRAHITLDQEHPPYGSVPATSGWHYEQPLAPVRWGIYEEFVADEYVVHNLEHGGIAIRYNCPDGCDQLVQDLTRIVNRALAESPPLKVLLSPYPDMDTRIALTAWTFIDKFDEFDEDRIVEFIQAHESSPNAPEATAR